MTRELRQKCVGVPDITLREGLGNDMYYLDHGHKKRLMTAWNQNAGRQLLELLQGTKSEMSGTVILAAIHTELPLVDPVAPAGIYLLRLVLPAAGKSPYMELATLDNQPVTAWKASSHVLQTEKLDENGGYSFSESLMPWEYGQVRVECKLGCSSDGSYPFMFELQSETDDVITRLMKPVTARNRGPFKTWTKEWLRIQQP